jgi:hypothetical protein
VRERTLDSSRQESSLIVFLQEGYSLVGKTKGNERSNMCDTRCCLGAQLRADTVEV